MKLNDYFNKQGHGAMSVLAKSLSVSVVTVHFWSAGKRPVPAVRCSQIETATAGAVTRRDLRADWADIWPELASAAPGTTTPPLN